jgi:hypothetical protein
MPANSISLREIAHCRVLDQKGMVGSFSFQIVLAIGQIFDCCYVRAIGDAHGKECVLVARQITGFNIDIFWPFDLIEKPTVGRMQQPAVHRCSNGKPSLYPH